MIEWEPIDILEMDEILFKLLNADGGDDVRKVVSICNEPVIKEIDMPDGSWKLSAVEFWGWNSKKNALRKKYLDAWQVTSLRTYSGQPIDGLIMPSGGHVAPPHGSMTYLMYEAISNVLDWTCATIPVGFVENDIDKPYQDFKPRSRYDKENYRKCKSLPPCRKNWLTSLKDTPEAYEGAPVALQLMGQRLSEEKVLGMLATIDSALERSPGYQT